MKFIVLVFFSFLSIPLCISQEWNGHFSFNNSIDTSIGNGKIFTASENAIYIYSTSTDQLEEISTIDGLSGDFISNIYYSSNFNKLVIGYENGLLQIIDFSSDSVLTIYDIIEKERSLLIPGFNSLKKTALEIGALGCGISGSGPSVYALSRGLTKAEEVASGFKNVISRLGIDYDIYISKINSKGVRKSI